MPCYLCRELYEYYTKHVLPDAAFIMQFLPDFTEDDNMCERCFVKFRDLFDLQNPSTLLNAALASSSSQIDKLELEPTEGEEEMTLARKRIRNEIKKAMHRI